MRQSLLVLVLFFLLALVLTYPLVTHLGTKLVGGEDANYALWLGWWYKLTLFEKHQNPLAWNNYLFYPDGYQLGSSFNGPIFHLAEAVGLLITNNHFFVYNLLCLITLTFSAWATFLFLRYWVKQSALAFLGGLAVGFSPYQLAHLIRGHTTMISFGFVPLFLWRFLILLREPSRRNVGWGAFTLWLVGISCWNYLYFVFLCLGFYLMYTLVIYHQKSWRFVLVWLKRSKLILWLFLSFFLLLPFLWPMVSSARRGETITSHPKYGELGSADLSSFFLPSPASNLGKLISSQGFYDRYYTYNESEATTFWGWLEVGGLLLVLGGLFDWLINKRSEFTNHQSAVAEISPAKADARPLEKIWLFLLGFTALLALGPSLRVLGKDYLPLPGAILAKIPFAAMSRVSARLAIFSLFFLVIFLTVNLARWYSGLRRSRRLAFFGVILLLLLGERVFLPFPLLAEQPSEFFTKIAEDQEDYAIANLPLSDINRSTNYQQMAHRKKIVGGYGSTYAETSNVLKFIRTNPLFRVAYRHFYYGEHFNWRMAENIWRRQPVEDLFKVFAENNIHYLVVHKNLLKGEEHFLYQKFLEQYLAPKPIWFEDDVVRVYKTG